MGEVRLKHKHPRAIRWFHWINFPVLTLMIWSGLLIYWAHDVYRVGIGSWTVFHFFPAWFYDTLTVSGRPCTVLPWKRLIAFCASSAEDMVTKAKPRDLPVNLSCMRATSETLPASPKVS